MATYHAAAGWLEESGAVSTATLARPAFNTRDWANLVLDSLPDQIYVKDSEGRFVLVNAATAHFFNTTPDAILGRTDFDFFPAGLAEQFASEERALAQSGQPLINREACLTDAQGRARWLLTTKVALRDRAGEFIGVAGVNHDISARKQAAEQLHQFNADLARSQIELLATYENLKNTQAKLIQAEKLESIGQLAAGIAHEIKNPLAILLMGVGYFEDCLQTGQPETDTVLHDMRDAVERADAIVRELLDYAAPRELQPTTENLNSVVDRALRLVHHEFSARGIQVVRKFAPALPPRQIDRIRIEQVFINLFMNACHAMPKGGTLTVRTSLRDADVVVEVLDTGTGIPPEALAKVFDPFFTTKPVGVGSGMGLAVAQQIILQHTGTLEVANRPEGGVQATIVFHNGKGAVH
ncbi:MAG: Adaptive-response sensory-kinase SasA [Verrucomicrobiae bacterium]|nr:Adaptive-response sensory-kinase SasA [Verrucomicrobiae bacterium]